MRCVLRALFVAALPLAACSGGTDGTAPPPQVTAVTVTAPDSLLLVGQSLTLQAIAKDASGNTLTGQQVTWSSSDAAKATITTGGVVTGLDTGTVDLTATVDQQSGSATLRVRMVATVIVSAPVATLYIGQSTTLQAEVLDNEGTAMTGLPVGWSSSDAVKASITQAGVATAHDTGTVSLTATVEQQSGSLSLALEFVPVATVQLDPGGDTLAVGQTVQLSATPEDSAGQPVTGHTVSFASSDINVAQVSATGLVSAIGTGAASIIASSGGAADTANILVPACTASYLVNAGRFALPLVPGGIRSSTGTTDDGTYRTIGVIFGGGPIFGTDTSHVVIGYDPSSGATDLAASAVCQLGVPSSIHTYAKLPLGNTAPSITGLSVTEEVFSDAASPNDAFVLFRYVFSNAGATPITGLTSGFVMDWDLNFDATPLADVLRPNPATGLGEAVEPDTITYPQIMAVLPIAAAGALTYHGWENGSDPSQRSEFYSYLTDTSVPSSIGPTDIRAMTGRGPFTVPAHGHVSVYFAVVGGDNRADFNAALAAAQARATGLGL